MQTFLSHYDKPHEPVVVIIGGGFGGLSAAKALADAPVRLVVIDRKNHHVFQPLLYQVATAALSPADIAQPIRAILANQKNVTVILDEVKEIKTDTKEVVTGDVTIQYDYLIVAAGARHSYFGKDEWEEFAPGLKSVEDALELRRRILLAFEAAEKARTDEERRAALTFVVVGAGPTGVEMAGAIAELARFSLRRDFRRIDPAHAQVILVEGAPRVLPPFTEKASAAALRQLQALHVDVRLNSMVKSLSEDQVDVNGDIIYSRTIIWAAGNKASPLASMLGAETDRQGRVKVSPDLSIAGHPEIFAVGDMAAATFNGGKPVPGVSPAALQGGNHAAQNILRLIKGQKTETWNYFDKGSLATIGRNAAVAEVGKLNFSGFPAWLTWLFVHLFFLIGFRNRFAVFMNWLWSYFTFAKGARLITGRIGRRGLIPDLAERQNPT